MSFYPDLDQRMLLPLKVFLQGMQNDPLFLDRPECPYDDDLRASLRDFWLKFRVVTAAERVPTAAAPMVEDGEAKWDSVGAALHSIYKELADFSSAIPESDVKERMAYFRTATALLEKITSLGERTANVREVSQFKALVLQVFDQVLTPDQRTTAMELLKQ